MAEKLTSAREWGVRWEDTSRAVYTFEELVGDIQSEAIDKALQAYHECPEHIHADYAIRALLPDEVKT